MPVYAPHAKQAQAHAFKTNRMVLLWGRQVGKTVWAVNHAWIKGIQKQGRYFIIFPTYRQAKDTIWNQYLHYIPKELIAKTDSSDLTITFKHIKGDIALPGIGWVHVEHDESLPPTSIELKGSEDADKLRGMKAQGLIFDEYAIQSPEHWSTVFEPMLSTTNGWAAFISTPKGFNHYYDMVLHAEAHPESWDIAKATWRDNPSITKEFIASVRKDADDRGDLSSFLQEYELEFRSVEGAVYPEFKRDVHVIPPSDVPTEGTIVAGIDFGWENPTACNFVLIDNDQNWYIFDEIHVTKTKTEDTAQLIKNKMMDKHLTVLVGDSAAPESIDMMRTQRLPIVPVIKRQGAIKEGIKLVGEKLKPRLQLVGMPKPRLYITSNCRHTIEEFEGYKYPSKKVDRNASEEPIKHNDHHMDAIRYLALHMKFGTMSTEERPKTGPQWDEYGLPA